MAPADLWTPAWSLCSPAYLRPAHGALDPITPNLLRHDDLALGAVHGFPFLHQLLQDSDDQVMLYPYTLALLEGVVL